MPRSGLVGPITVAADVVMAVSVSAQTTRTDAPKGTTRAWSPARTPDGQPDLQGVWSDTAVTPLERPRALEGRQFLTEQEVNRLKARADRLFNNATSDFVPGDNLFLALLSDVDAVDNPNATGSRGGRSALDSAVTAIRTEQESIRAVFRSRGGDPTTPIG